MGFTDRDGRPVAVPDPPREGSAYAQIGAFQGGDYARNAFTRGTVQEAAVLMDVLALPPRARVLDVGCGHGRHVAALRSRGHRAVGVDLSPAVLMAPASGAAGALVAGTAQALPLPDGCMDGVISVCQGGFGITPQHDEAALGEWYRVLRTGGRIALTAFSLVFAARYMGAAEAVDVERGLHHHMAEVRGPDGSRATFDLWTAAYSPAHLSLLLTHHGFRVLGMTGIEPGGFQTRRQPTIADPELLVWAERC